VALEDLAGAPPFTLPVVGESRTGGELPARVEPGTTCRVFTGARVPPRGDAVVMQEEVAREGERATFARVPRRGENVRRAGEDLEAGGLALGRGTRLGFQHVALLAALERTRVTVARRPVVSILSTGDELREAGEPDRPGSVVDCNGPALAALVRACGGIPRRLPFVPDDLEATREALSRALEGADLVLTVGGVSVGEHDVVKPALAAVGIELDFWKVAIKPGKPLAVGRTGAKRFLGLPGNPASAMLTFLLFGAPLLRALQGDRAPTAPRILATLGRDVAHAQGRLEFARARLEFVGGRVVAHVLPGQASGSVPSMAWADALVLLPADVGRLTAGATVEAMRFADV
jgi:molybdopterin molybdotransferase